jgi:hypothetical protein
LVREVKISIIDTANNDITPPETLFISAIDTNGNFIDVDDETVSKSITFDFTGIDNVDDPSDLLFNCSIDTDEFVPCDSPFTYSNRGLGQHIFKVFATDSSGNSDPIPEQFTWSIIALSVGTV